MAIDVDAEARLLGELRAAFEEELLEDHRTYIPEVCAARQAELFRLAERLEEARFDRQPIRLVVAGEFSAGKSSVINSLIGEELIPVGPEPMTMAPAYFQYGEVPSVLIEFTNGPPEEITIEAFRAIKHTEAERLPPKYRDIKMIHFRYPYPKLDRVHIIDTPGFSTATARGDDSRTLAVIEEYADVLLWVFNANAAPKASEVKIIKEISKTLRVDGVSAPNGQGAAETGGIVTEMWRKIRAGFAPQQPAGTGDLRRSVRIIGLLNYTDQKGRPKSDTVNSIVSHVARETGLELVIPYSAHQALAHRRSNLEVDLGRVLPALALAHGVLQVERKVTKEGTKTATVIRVTDGGGNEVFRNRYQDLTMWIEPLEQLEACVGEIRAKTRDLLTSGIHRDIRELRDALINDIDEVQRRFDGEVEAILVSIQKVHAFLEYNRSRSREYLKEQAGQFERYCVDVLANALVDSVVDPGFFSNGMKLKIKKIDEAALFAGLWEGLELDSLLEEMVGNLVALIESDEFGRKVENPFLHELFEIFRDALKRSRPHLGDKAYYAARAALNVAQNSTLSVARSLDDLDVSSSNSLERARYEAAAHLYSESSYFAVYHWLGQISNDFHVNQIEYVADCRKTMLKIKQDYADAAQRARARVTNATRNFANA